MTNKRNVNSELTRIREYLTEEQKDRYDRLLTDMKTASLDLQEKINGIKSFLEKEGLLENYKKNLPEELKELLLPEEKEKKEESPEKKETREKELKPEEKPLQAGKKKTLHI